MNYDKHVFSLLELKTNEENPDIGIFSGYLSTYDVDSQKDKVMPGAYSKTINDAMQRKNAGVNRVLFPLLFNHDTSRPVGGFTAMREDSKGLYVEGFVDKSTPDGNMVYSGMKNGYLSKMSIGYRTIKSSIEKGTNVRLLQEIQLFEGSAVVIPANNEATIETVKSEDVQEEMCERCRLLEQKLADLLLENETKAGRKISASNHQELTGHCDNAMTGMQGAMEAMKCLKKSLDVLGQSDAGENEVSDTPDKKADEQPLDDNTEDIGPFIQLSEQIKRSMTTDILQTIKEELGK